MGHEGVVGVMTSPSTVVLPQPPCLPSSPWSCSVDFQQLLPSSLLDPHNPEVPREHDRFPVTASDRKIDRADRFAPGNPKPDLCHLGSYCCPAPGLLFWQSKSVWAGAWQGQPY
jgi:hypothetical protein